MRAADPGPGRLVSRVLGLDADEHGLWLQEAGPTAFATFESETDYMGSRSQQAMITSGPRPGGDARSAARQGADVVEETQEMAGVGVFGWVTDPEGTRIELWQPA